MFCYDMKYLSIEFLIINFCFIKQLENDNLLHYCAICAFQNGRFKNFNRHSIQLLFAREIKNELLV